MAKQHRLKEVADMVHTGTFRMLKAGQKIDAELRQVTAMVTGGNEDEPVAGFELELNIGDDRHLYRIIIREVNVRGGG